MDVRKKLIDILNNSFEKQYEKRRLLTAQPTAEDLISNGVTVQEHGYWETVVEVRDNTVCGNGVKIEYKRCSHCKTPAKFFEDDFCGNCGTKLDLPQPPKGE